MPRGQRQRHIVWTPTEVIALRHLRRHTVTAAAQSVGVDRRTWQRWESGAYVPDENIMRAYMLAC